MTHLHENLFLNIDIPFLLETAMHQMDVVTDVTISLGKGLKKSIKSCSKEAVGIARSVGEFVDVEDVMKSVHKVAHPEKHAERKSSIIHKPIGWSEDPPSTFRNFPKDILRVIKEEDLKKDQSVSLRQYSSEAKNTRSRNDKLPIMEGKTGAKGHSTNTNRKAK